MAIFNKDMMKFSRKNELWQNEVYPDAKLQIVLKSIPAGRDIGVESHRADQTTFIVEGEARLAIDGHNTRVGPNHLVIVPKRAEHNVVNKGSAPLKLFSVYAPPAEPEGAAFKTRAEAEEAERRLFAKADKVKAAVDA